MNSYPVTLHPEHFRPLIIGGGRVAVRKLKGMLNAGFRPTLISTDFSAEMQSLILEHHLPALLQPCSDDILHGFNLIIAATSDKKLNQHISDSCRRLNLLVNNVNAPRSGNFSLPAVVDRGCVKIAVSTDGELPLLSKMIRNELDIALHPEIDTLCARLIDTRKDIIRQASDENEKQTRIDQTLKPMVEDLIRILFTH